MLNIINLIYYHYIGSSFNSTEGVWLFTASGVQISLEVYISTTLYPESHEMQFHQIYLL